jgi:lysophospholipase L1-like esterase
VHRPPAPWLIALFSTVLTLAAAEWVARTVILDERAYRICDPETHHALAPNTRSRHRWEDSAVVPLFTNSLGLRDEAARRIDGPAGRPRVLFLGDSFTEGVGVSFEQSFVGVLSARLPAVEFFNGGVMSHAPTLEYRTLRRVGPVLQPDLVVVLVDPSDVQDELYYEREGVKDADGEIQRFRCPRWRSAVKRSALGRLVGDAVRRLLPGLAPATLDESNRLAWADSDSELEGWGRRGLERLSRSLDRIAAYGAAHGSATAFVLYPWPKLIGSAAETPQVAEYRARIARVGAARGVPVLDLFPLFGPQDLDRLFIPGDVHWNPKGHELIAQHLAEFIRPLLAANRYHPPASPTN